MTNKEMHKLSRRELLQLLLTQGRETEELRKSLAETEAELEQLTGSYEHLKRRLDRKDEQIKDLRETLHRERTNRQIELEEAGSIAEAALRLNGVFEVAQKAAEQYLYNIRLLYERKVAENSAGKGESDPEAEILKTVAGESEPQEIGTEVREPEENEAEMSELQETEAEKSRSEEIRAEESEPEETGSEESGPEENEIEESRPEEDKAEESGTEEDKAEDKAEESNIEGNNIEENREEPAAEGSEEIYSEEPEAEEEKSELEEVELEQPEEQTKSRSLRKFWRRRAKNK